MVWDFAFRTIPNGHAVIVALAALVVRGIEGQLAGALLACLLCFIISTVCWLRGWLGGGDVKLLSAVVLLVAPVDVPGLLAEIAFAGGALAVCYLILSLVVSPPRGRPPVQLVHRVLRVERWRMSRRRSIPYGCAIATGALLMLLNG